jgi:uncharacterized protein YjbI with pentapeptide repeats
VTVLVRWRRLVVFSGTMFVLGACTSAVRVSKLTATLARGVVPPSVDVCAVPPFGTSYAGQDLRNANFHKAAPGSLRGANFDNADLRGASFANQDLTGASFRHATLGKSDDLHPAVFAHATLDHTCFREAVMNDADLQYARITCADFSKTSLMHALFGPIQYIREVPDCRTRFIEATLDVHSISPSHWRGIDFTKADFKNYQPSNFSLAGLDLTGLMVAQTLLPGVDMSRSDLTRADLTETNLVNANLQDSTLNGATVKHTKLAGAQLHCARAYGLKGSSSESSGSPCQANRDSTAPTAPADFTTAELSGADLSNGTFDNAQFRGAVLAGVTATNASFQKAAFIADSPYIRTSFAGADLTAANFSGAKLDDLNFADGILTNANFSATTLYRTAFAGAIMPGANFSQATLEGVNFHGAILQSANFSRTVIQLAPEVDFSCAQLGGVDFTTATVKEATFLGAVMPSQPDCCSSEVKCGLVNVTHLPYGATTPPALTAENHSISCPDGSVSPCASWQLSNWRTAACNAAGDPRPRAVWSKPSDCTAGPSDILTFADPKLGQCVSEAVMDNPAAPVSRQQAVKLTRLTCAGMGIQNLGGLEALTGLSYLDLSNNVLTDVTIVQLSALRTVIVSGNKLTSLQLNNMPLLVRVDASNNQLTAIGLDSNAYPVVLDLSANRFAAFDLAFPNDRLTFVDLSSNLLTNVFDQDNHTLAKLPRLVHLDVSNNQLTTLGAVSTTNPQLSSLNVSCNRDFKCDDLGYTSDSAVLQNSGCALFNSATNGWVKRLHPEACP